MTSSKLTPESETRECVGAGVLCFLDSFASASQSPLPPFCPSVLSGLNRVWSGGPGHRPSILNEESRCRTPSSGGKEGCVTVSAVSRRPSSSPFGTSHLHLTPIARDLSRWAKYGPPEPGQSPGVWNAQAPPWPEKLSASGGSLFCPGSTAWGSQGPLLETLPSAQTTPFPGAP